MLYWQTELTRRLLQKNAAAGLAISIALHLLVVLILNLDFIKANVAPLSDSRRVVPVQLQPYAEIIRLETGGGQGGGEGGGSLTAPTPKEIPGVPVPVPDAVAQADTLPMTPVVSPAIDSANAGGTGLSGSSWGSGGTGWGTGSGSGVGLSVISQPVVTSLTVPEYPQAARKAKIHGLVKLHLKVNETGKVEKVIVLHNTTQNDACVQAAIEAAYRNRYRPAQTAAGPDTAWTVLTYSF